MPFQPGQSGNPGGRSDKRASFMAALERAVAQEDAKRVRAAAERLLDEAAKGEPWAIKELADRLDGKPKQVSEVTGVDGGPIAHALKVAFVGSDRASGSAVSGEA